MSSWLSTTLDRRLAWSDDSLERHRAATADAPVAWIARSVLEAIGRSAEYGHPHPVEGELLGYWVTPRVEVVVVDWTGFGSLLFHEPCVASAGTRGGLGDQRVLTPTSTALRMPVGVWSTEPVARATHAPGTHAFESMAAIHLLLERERGWQARLTMLPRTRWPWDALRRPRAVELRVFSPPRS